MPEKLTAHMPGFNADNLLTENAMLEKAYNNPAVMPPFNTGSIPAGDWVNETLLALNVHGKLLAEHHTDALSIHVSARGTAITLTGEVSDKPSLDLALSLVKSVAGVSQVSNRLTLRSAEAGAGDFDETHACVKHEIQDALLETIIKSKLIARTGKSAFFINVHVSGGIVRLSGESPDRAHRNRVLLITRQTTGAGEVHDQIQVNPAGARPN